MPFTEPDKQLKTGRVQSRPVGIFGGDRSMNGKAILENVRRYRAIASLYRQTAAFRPLQRPSLLEQAYEWENRALSELEGYFDTDEAEVSPLQTWMVQTASWPMLNAA
jgi:hypothetical protein